MTDSAVPPPLKAARMIHEERYRQQTQEGHSTEYDDDLTEGQLAVLAAYYALSSRGPNYTWLVGQVASVLKVSTENFHFKPVDPIRDLIRAGALILAELERRLRAEEKGETEIGRRSMIHELKTWPEFFEQMRCGRKKFELRRNDRDFRVGDQLLLREWDQEGFKRLMDLEHEPPSKEIEDLLAQAAYTGRDLMVRVDYIMTAADVAGFGYRGISPIDRGYVIMSISLVS